MLREVKALVKRLYSMRTASKLAAKGRGLFLERLVVIDFPGRVSVGDWVYVGPRCYFNGMGTFCIGSGVIFGPDVKVLTANHNYDSEVALPYDNKHVLKRVIIEDNVWIGSSAIILPGVRVGEGAIVGAGAVVAKDVPRLAIVAGNPARILKYRNEEVYDQLASDGKMYIKLKSEGKLIPDYSGSL